MVDVGTSSFFELLDRVANLVRVEERRTAMVHGLHPVHLHALQYLSRCNRYSNTPIGVTEYLGVTKGTVSQTLILLQERGLVESTASDRDRRMTHLRLTARGADVLSQAMPPDPVAEALRTLGPRAAEFEESLRALLAGLQRANGSRTFGACTTCRHHEQDAAGGSRCGLTKEPMAGRETTLLCREHEPASAP